MKIMLVNPATWLGDYAIYRKLIVPPIPPLSLCYLAAVAEQAGHQVDVYDQFKDRQPNEELARRIVDEGYDVVGVTCLVLSDRNVREFGKSLREASFSGRIVLGNTHAASLHESFLKEGCFDAVVHGEGEYAFVELLDAFAGKRELDEVAGISFVRDGRIVDTAPREPVQKLDELPFPAWRKIDMQQYDTHPMLFLYEPAAPIQASRGCPYNCFMCVQDAMLKRFRVRTPASVVDEILWNVDEIGVHNFGFLDSFFPPNTKWGWEFVAQLHERLDGRKIGFYVETRTDHVDGELFAALVEVGCKNVMVGFESSSDETLEKMNKGTTAEQGRKAMAALRKLDVATTGFFMIGFPWETEEMVRDTVRYALDLAPDILKFNIVTPLPGSQMFEDMRQEIGEDQLDFALFTGWTDMTSGVKPVSFSNVPTDRLLWHQRTGMMRHFIRPRILWRHLKLGTFRWKNLPSFFILGRNMLLGSLRSLLGK